MSNIINPHRFAAAGVTRQDDLLHWWKMVDDTDSIGSSSLTVAGVADPFGNAEAPFAGAKSMALDGTDDRADAQLATAIASPFTWSAWVYFGNAMTETLLQPINFSESTSPSYAVFLGPVVYSGTAAGNIKLFFKNYYLAGATESWDLSAGAAGDQWVYMAMTYDESEILGYMAYEDAGSGWPANPIKGFSGRGASAGESESNALPWSGRGLDNVVFGEANWGAFSQGNISDVRLYDAALPDTDIYKIYNGGAGDY